MIMRHDPSSRRQGYTANSYIWALEEGLRPYYQPGVFYLQDNAKLHLASHVKDWFEQHGIWVFEHPAHSPDLNPIEQVWKKMKDILRREFPGLSALKRNDENIQRVEEALRVAWERVPQALIDRLIESMPRRLQAVIDAKGWYTKY